MKLLIKLSCLLGLFVFSFNATHANELPEGWYSYTTGKMKLTSDKPNIHCIKHEEGRGSMIFTKYPLISGQKTISVSVELKQKNNSLNKTSGKAYLYLYDKNDKSVKYTVPNIQYKSKWKKMTLSLSNIPKTAKTAKFGIEVSPSNPGATCINTASIKWSDSLRANIYTKTWGKRSSPAVILVHGNNESGMASFLWLANELSRDFFVVAYDQRGFGKSKSSLTNYSFASQKNDLKYVIEKYNLNKYYLLGHSFGARIAMDYAASYPEQTKALILEDMDVFARYKTPASSCKGKKQIEIWGCIANSTDLASAFKSYLGEILVLQSDERVGYIKNINRMKQIRPDARIVKIKNSTHFIHDAKKHFSASVQMKNVVLDFLKE